MGASNANPFEDTKPEPPTNEEHALIDTWNTFGDAYEWAVSIGGCENTFEAKNSMNKIVDAHGGVSKATLPAIKLAYVRRQREKLAETQAA